MPRETSAHIIQNLSRFHDPGNEKTKQKDNMTYLEMNIVSGSGKDSGGGGGKDGGKDCGKEVLFHDAKNNKFAEDDSKTKFWNHRRKSDLARERWKILAKALLKPKRNPTKSFRDVSVRRFTTFELIIPNKLENKDKDGCWLRYSLKIQSSKYFIDIHHLRQNLTARELAGFNNTGNICIWPSEEVLAYYLISNASLFDGKEVLEIGGGMTCLAGVMLGKYGKVKRMDVTDGNGASVENVRRILARNEMEEIGCRVLNWSDYNKFVDKYDVVLSSDCLFFDETRDELVEALWHSLRDTGTALVMAPRRGNTLDLFLGKAIERGFLCISQSYYNDVVWRQHLKFKESTAEYDEDIHYPILLMLTKSGRGFSLHNCLSMLDH